MLSTDPNQSNESDVSHLLELGYVDPLEVSATRANDLRLREEELRHAREQLRAGRIEDARTLLGKLVDSDSDWIAPRLLLVEVYFHLFDRKSLQNELDWLAHHSVVTPRLALINATIALEHRDAKSAVFDLKYVCHVAPTLSGTQRLLGIAFTRLAQWEAADSAFREAIRQDENDARSLDGLSALALHHGDFATAADRALAALECDMQLASAHYHLGLALYRLERPIQAIEALKMSAKLSPSRAAPFYWLSRISRERGDTVAANEFRDRARAIIARRRSVGTSTPTQPW